MKLLKKDRKKVKQLLHYETWCQVFSFLFFILPCFQLKLPHCLKMNIVGKSSRVSSTFSFLYLFLSTLNPSHYCMPKAKYKLYSTWLSLLFSLFPNSRLSLLLRSSSYDVNTTTHRSKIQNISSRFRMHKSWKLISRQDWCCLSYISWVEYVFKHAFLCHHKIYIITRHEQISLL